MSTTFKPRTARITIYQGDDYEQIARLRHAAETAAKSKAPETLLNGELPKAERLAKEHDEFLAEATERAIEVTLEALGRKRWRSLIAEHKPREGNDEDEAVGINEDTFPDALVPASIVEPKFDTPADREAFLDALSDAQFGQLYVTAFALNRAVGEAPKALSSPSLSSGETSR